MADNYMDLDLAHSSLYPGSELYAEDAGSDEVDAAEIEQMLYSQIYFEHNESKDVATHSGEMSDWLPQVHVEEQEKTEVVSQHQSSVAPMLNFSARNFMSPETSKNLPQTQNEDSYKSTTKKKESKSKQKRKQKQYIENNISVIEVDSTADELEDKIPSKKSKMISDNKGVKNSKSRPKEKLVVLSDSDFEVEKLTDKQMAIKKRKIENVTDDKAPRKKPRKTERKGKMKTTSIPVISVDSDSEGSIMVLGDSGVFVENDDISVNAVGMSGDMQYSSRPRSSNLSQITLEAWDGDPPLSITQVHNLLEPHSWRISDDDMYGLQNSRYYGKQRGLQCRNCNERGHVERKCPKPRKFPACIQCGKRGHIRRKCPDSLCYNCNRTGHTNNECNRIRKSYHVTCKRCGAQGHIQYECPEIWRQFHMTTTYGQLHEHKQVEARNPYCYNCGERGHFGYACNEEGMHGFWYPAPPCVTSYDALDTETGMPEERASRGTSHKRSSRRDRQRHYSQQPSHREDIPYHIVDDHIMSSAKKGRKDDRDKKLRKQQRSEKRKCRAMLKRNMKELRATNDFETNKKIKKSKKKVRTDDNYIPVRIKPKKNKTRKKGHADKVDLSITVPHDSKGADWVPRTIFDSEVVDFPRGGKKSKKEKLGKNTRKRTKREEVAAMKAQTKTSRKSKSSERGFNVNLRRIL